MEPARANAPGRRSSARSAAPRAVAVVAALLLIAGLAHTVAGLPMAAPLDDARHLTVFAVAAVLLLMRAALVRSARGVWLAFGVGLVLYWLAETLWAGLYGDATSTPADVVYLLSYAAFGVGLHRYLRRRVGDALPTFSVDAVGIAMSLIAVGAALTLVPLVQHGEPPAETVLNLGYPAMDVAICAVVFAASSFTGRRKGRQDTLLGLAFLATGVADIAWLMSLAGMIGAWADPWMDLGWEAMAILLAAAGWARPGTAGALRVGSWGESVPTLSLLAAGTGVLVWAWRFDLPATVVVLGGLTLALGALRSVRMVREVRAVIVSRAESLVDDVTGVANQRALFSELSLLLSEHGEDGRRVALLICDLEGFDELTDTLGHEAGGHLLTAVAARLAGAAPGTLARVDGDQFATIVEDGDPEAVAALLTAALAAPVAVEGVAVGVRPVFGYARFPEDASTPAGLARRADVARRDAKALGLGVAAYDVARDGFSRERLALAADLRAALAAPAASPDGLWLAFQPQVEAASGAVVGVEALVRWRHPSRGELTPAVLLPVAERSGQMAALTDWVLEGALAEVAGLRAAGRPLRVSVNVSAATLIDVGLPDRIAAALARHALPADALVVEVTENAVMVDHHRCLDVLGRIAAVGVEISIDDFGTGHSSLAQLHRLAADELKIDRRFVSGLAREDALDGEIVALVAGLGRRMGVRVVAEGIEAPEERAALAALGCDLLQGFGIGMPMTPAELATWLGEADAPARRR